ncbi:trichohyalin-like protein 1 [Bos indicus]|uniref:Trichohyalin-like protein 1 n=2 Tax=Bos TaxID=9903 RepID=TCHL1_BOVIN|nr:trichohyalin-like protein 1 [Bos taurus]A6QP92.2 RecName: Full=Trichohyalin-like protein 1 [Bos taurus]
MPQLLRDILCVIETFHKYAREDAATLTCTELKQLIQSEFEDIFQPCAIHAVERNLNLLNIDSNGAISFDEFVLAIFSFLNVCYLDTQSLLNSEPRQVSKPEGMPHDMGLQVTNETDQWTEGTSQTQDKVVLPSGTASSTHLSLEERAVEHNRVDPQGHTTAHKLPVETSEHSDSKNQHLKGDEQSQKVDQDVSATGDSRTQRETSKPMAGSEQISSHTKGEGQNKEILQKGDILARKQSGTETGGRFGEQEGSLGILHSPLEETTQRPGGSSEDQEVAGEKGVKGHPKSQEPSVQGKDEPSSEHVDLPKQAAARKPSQTQKSAAAKDESRTAETPEPPIQEKEYETRDLSVQGENRNVSETPMVRVERKGVRGPEVHQTVGQKQIEEKTQPPALEEPTEDKKYHELQESSKEKNAGEDSETHELNSEGGEQKDSESEGAISPGEEARHAEEGTAEALVNSKNAPEAEGTPGTRERIWELTTLENQSGEKNKMTTKIHDKLVKEDDGYQGEGSEPVATQNDERSPETPNSLTAEDGDSNSETSDLFVQGDSQSQTNPFRGSVQGSDSNNPETQKHLALSEEKRVQEAAVLAVRGEDEQVTEEHAQEHEGQGSATTGRGPAVEPRGHSDTQVFIVRDENTKSLEPGIPGAPNAGITKQLSVRQLPTKKDSRKELKDQSPSTKKEEDGALEAQEDLVKSLDENNAVSQKTCPATLEEETESPQQLAGEQSLSTKEHDPSVSESGLEERMQRDQELCLVERGAEHSSPLYEALQEKMLQQTNVTQGEHQNQAQTASVASPEIRRNQSSASLTNDSSDGLVFFIDRQALQKYIREFLPDEDPTGAQQISAPQALEDKQGRPQREELEPQKEASAPKQ